MVTGASGNLGSAVAVLLAGEGARLIAVDRNQDRLDSMFANNDLIRRVGGMDLTHPRDVERSVQTAIDQYGSIYGLVNTVGGYRGGRPVHETPAEDWEFLFSINLRTAAAMCAAAIPHMRVRSNGRIVNVSAAPALKAPASLGAYSASKAAVLRLTEALAAENKKHGITANAVLPGTIDTPQNRQAMPEADTSTWVAPEAIAAVIAFLLSDQGWPVTGGAIPVTGQA